MGSALIPGVSVRIELNCWSPSWFQRMNVEKQHRFGGREKSHRIKSSVTKKGHFSTASRKFQITFVVCISSLLDSTDPDRLSMHIGTENDMLYY